MSKENSQVNVQTFPNPNFPLKFEILSSFGNARASILTLPHGKCRTPMFMPVGTQGAIKGITTGQMKDLDVDLMLSNTYFMNLRPGADVVDQLGGLHGMMCWDRCILTDRLALIFYLFFFVY
jgi:queuine tRNA-ribosyltransferase